METLRRAIIIGNDQMRRIWWPRYPIAYVRFCTTCPNDLLKLNLKLSRCCVFLHHFGVRIRGAGTDAVIRIELSPYRLTYIQNSHKYFYPANNMVHWKTAEVVLCYIRILTRIFESIIDNIARKLPLLQYTTKTGNVYALQKVLRRLRCYILDILSLFRRISMV